jgi:hypothetical protein
MRLIWLRDYQMAAQLEESGELRQPGTLLMTYSVEVSHAMRMWNISYLNLWALVTPDELKDIYLEARGIARQTCKEGRATQEIRYHGVDIGELFEEELVFPIELILCGAKVLRRVLAAHSITEILAPDMPFFRTRRNGPPPGDDSADSVFLLVLTHLAGERGIFVERRELLRRPSKLRRRSVWRAVRDKIGAARQRRMRPRVRGAGFRVLVIESFIREAEVRFLKDAFANDPRFDVVWVPANMFQSGHPLQMYLQGVRRNLSEKLQTVVTRAMNAGLESAGGALFAGETFSRLWTEIAQETSELVAIIEAASLLRIKYRPDVVLIGLTSFPSERAIAAYYHSVGVPIASVTHGAISTFKSRMEYSGRADVVFCNGRKDAEILRSQNDRPTVVPIGLMEFPGSDFEMSTPVFTSAEAVSAQTEKVLLLTGKVSVGLGQVATPPAEHLEDLLRVVSSTLRRPRAELRLRPHPSYDYFGLYESLIRDQERAFISTGALDEDIAWADRVVMVNYVTSACIPALMSRKPVFLIGRAWRGGYFWETTIPFACLECQDDFDTVPLASAVGRLLDESAAARRLRELETNYPSAGFAAAVNLVHSLHGFMTTRTVAMIAPRSSLGVEQDGWEHLLAAADAGHDNFSTDETRWLGRLTEFCMAYENIGTSSTHLEVWRRMAQMSWDSPVRLIRCSAARHVATRLMLESFGAILPEKDSAEHLPN